MQKNRLTLLVIAAFAALPAIALAQTTSTTTTTSTAQSVPLNRLATEYTTLAGSQTNAESLVSGLRNGTEITLTSTSSGGQTTTSTFTPATGKMGVGNVNISLALASASLQQAGITNPTPAQLQAALNGGTVTNSSGQTTTFTGVLTMRADGKGWGQIAQALGFKLGDVMRSAKANAAIAEHKPSTNVAKTERAEKVERPERAERPDRPERPERPQLPERVGPGR